MNKKRVILFSIIFLLAVALVAVALFVPTVHLICKNGDKAVVYEKSVGLIQYIKDAPFLITDAGEVYFDATGPIWMATAAIMVNFIIAVGGAVLALVCLIEISICWLNGLATKDNVLARKMAICVGSVSMFLAVFEAVSYYVTTSMANGYVEFNWVAGPFVLFGLALVVFVLAFFTGKREPNQKVVKYRNIVGFSLCALTSAICSLVLFIPQFTEVFLLPDRVTPWSVASFATKLDPYYISISGDIPFGIAQYVMFAIFVASAFVLVYSIIGIVRALCGKSTNWLSARVKRWSMALLLVYLLLYLLMIAQVAVIWGTPSDPLANIWFVKDIAIALMFVPYLPYVFSTFVSYNKVNKQKQRIE